jgi:hypothetical protein
MLLKQPVVEKHRKQKTTAKRVKPPFNLIVSDHRISNLIKSPP